MRALSLAPQVLVTSTQWTRVLFMITLIGGIDLQFLLPQQAFSQQRPLRADGMCAAQGTVAAGQLVDTVINLKILLVQFTDVTCRKATDGISPRYSTTDFENLLGSEGIYVSPGMHSPDGDEVFGSLNDFYLNMSGGKLRVHAVVVNRTERPGGKLVWITLGQRKQYYQETDNAIFSDALEAAYREGLDPSVSDNTRLAIIYAGNAYFLGGGLNPRSRPERTAYIMSEVQGRPYNQESQDAKFSRIGIHCHEFAHTIGIDHSTGGRADLMYGGTVNGSVEGNAPAPLNAIVRARYGWANVIPVENTGRGGVDLPYSLTRPTVYLMKNSQGDQFYIENRRFDRTMNIGGTVVPDYNNVAVYPPAWPHHSITEGIFVWRVNTTGDRLDPGYSTDGLVYASGRYGRTFPENEQSDTDDGVPFPGVSNNRLLSPWSDPRNPYIREVDFFGSASTHYNLFVPNTKGGSTSGMEVVSEDRAGGTFHVKFSSTAPPNPALEQVPDSMGSYDGRRTILRQDSGSIHQVMEVGGEIFYRRSTDNGLSWSVPSRISQGNGGNSTPSIALAGPALLLAWQMDAYDAADTGRVVLMSRSTDAGKSWSDYMSVGWSYRCSVPGAYPSLAGARDGSAMIVYRADRSSLVSALSHDAGITWSGASPVPVGEISWSTPSLLFGGALPGGVGDIAYCTDSLSGRVKIMVNGFMFGTSAWGSPVTVSGIVPQEYTGFKNPNIVTATQDAPSALNVVWDATDSYTGVPVIITRSVDLAHPGSSYSVFKGVSQNDLSAVQISPLFSGKSVTSCARVLTMTDPASGASLSIEIGLVRLLHRGGNVDTVRLSGCPSDTLTLDVSGLLQAGRTSDFALSPDADTLQVVAAIYGRNPGTLIAGGRVGFEIVWTGIEPVIGEFGVESAASIPNGTRRLVLLSIPVSGLPCQQERRTVVIRPFVAGLRQESGLTASFAQIYSNASETPVDRILTGAGGNASQAAAPLSFALEQNYPNPFNPSTTIRYGLPARTSVRLVMFNTLGQEVTTLVDEVQDPGIHEVKFNGSTFASGVYFYRLIAGEHAGTKRLLLLR